LRAGQSVANLEHANGCDRSAATKLRSAAVS
jgi:hypothetical protein